MWTSDDCCGNPNQGFRTLFVGIRQGSPVKETGFVACEAIQRPRASPVICLLSMIFHSKPQSRQENDEGAKSFADNLSAFDDLGVRILIEVFCAYLLDFVTVCRSKKADSQLRRDEDLKSFAGNLSAFDDLGVRISIEVFCAYLLNFARICRSKKRIHNSGGMKT